MTSLDCIVFVRRQSPDWDALTRDYEAGRFIEPSRYAPPPELPGFPDDTVVCIQTWNQTFWINFFRCREILKRLSEHSVRKIKNSLFITDDQLSELPAMVGQSRFLLFFFDDDDWFAPDMFERLSTLDLSECDIAVFPMVRLGDNIITFVRPGKEARALVGARADFTFRFMTNNYGISSKIALSKHLPKLQDHMLGSAYADQQDFRDPYFDVPVSVTNKTPCSASAIGRLPADPASYRESIRRYTENLRQTHIPPEFHWMNAPIGETINLFQTM
jgi:hypothetical protein